MKAEIMSIGTELLMGELVDTNSTYLASELAKIGVELSRITKVGDNPDQLREVLDSAWRRSDVIVTTGGLGPTSDDLTRETIAKVLDEEMFVNNGLLKHLKSLFDGRGYPMPESNVKQATLISSAYSIPNPLGTAPGWFVEKDQRIIVAMPGPPRELQRMWNSEVKSMLKERNQGVTILTKTFKTFGITEGGLNELVSPLFENLNPYLGIYSKSDGIHLRAIASASNEDEASELLRPIEREIRGTVGKAIWGIDDETPEGKMAEFLNKQGESVGIIESFTCGLLVSTLGNVPDSGSFMKGGIVVYDPKSYKHYGVDEFTLRNYGIVSAETAESMATGARIHFRTKFGIGVSPGSLDFVSDHEPARSGSLYIGFSSVDHTTSVCVNYSQNQLRIRQRTVTQVMLKFLNLFGNLTE